MDGLISIKINQIIVGKKLSRSDEDCRYSIACLEIKQNMMPQLEIEENDFIIVSLLTVIASCLTFKKRTEQAKIIVQFALKMQNNYQDARDLEEYLCPTKHTSKIVDQDDDKQKLKQQSQEDDISIQINPMLPYFNEEEVFNFTKFQIFKMESPQSPKQKVLIYKQKGFVENIIQFLKCKDKKK